MTAERAEWQDFSIPNMGLRLRYPQHATDGEPVEMDDVRAHFRTMDSTQVYFEVSRHTGTTARDLIARETGVIRRAEPKVQITEPAPILFAGHDALRFTVTFPDRERIFTIVERGAYVYRVVYDPRSPINEEIVETVEFT